MKKEDDDFEDQNPDYNVTPPGINAQNILTDIEMKEFKFNDDNKPEEQPMDAKVQNSHASYDSQKQMNAQATSYVDELNTKVKNTLE